MAKPDRQTKRSLVMRRAGIPVPVPPGPEDWWSFTIISDTPENRECRRARFLKEAEYLFRKGGEALGAEQALQIWEGVPPKGKKSEHDPIGDAAARAIYRDARSAGATEQKARAVAVEYLMTRPHRQHSKESNQRHLRRLLSKDEKLALKKRIHGRLIAAYVPTWGVIAPDK